MQSLTVDQFLGGRLLIQQPTRGFRSGSDAVFLAASVSEGKPISVLDVGCGVGVASLCVARRLPHVFVTGVDVMPSLIMLAQENAAANLLEDKVSFKVQDISEPLSDLSPQSFDCVISNPPYFQNSTLSHHPGRSKGRHYEDSFLREWVNFCFKMTKPRGMVHFIFPTPSLQALLNCFPSFVGGWEIFPLWPREDAPCSKRSLILARKGVKSPSTIHKGLVLHEIDAYTAAAKEVLWDGKGLFPEKLAMLP